MLGKATEECEEVPKTIVFCRTKNDCVKVYNFLCKSSPKHAVTMYHSSLTQATRDKVQELFKSRGAILRCLSATIAFGMVILKYFRRVFASHTNIQGMDIPDVELVVVYGIPDTASQLYQVLETVTV